ncbi:hypothetical protein MesoLj131c_65850 (plasmid) [Mesorhizobium sp. 131-3-5]|nr:hypothetical protein MesoLj131c_65850 [Mesorhizobium sp. 131-3-5]
MQRQLKLTFPDEESERRPDPPAWEKLDAERGRRRCAGSP